MGVSIDIYLIQLVHGLIYGMLMFLVASGLTLIFGRMGVLNIANVAFYMLGAYLTYNGSIRRDVKFPCIGKDHETFPASKVTIPATPDYNPRCR